jgi:glycosyltransferase involved in cell wall biosynthesis
LEDCQISNSCQCGFHLRPFGLPLIEAMAYGVPAITSNRSSMPEVVGDAGILVDPNDSNSISAALSLLLTDHTLLKRLSDNAAKRVTLFDWNLSAKKTLDIFEEVFEKNTN